MAFLKVVGPKTQIVMDNKLVVKRAGLCNLQLNLIQIHLCFVKSWKLIFKIH